MPSTSSPQGSVNKWQAASTQAGGKPKQDFRRHKRNSSSQNSNGSKNSSTSKSSSNPSFTRTSTRVRGIVEYERHIAFYGSVLSNFHKGSKFSGSSAMPYLFEQLTLLNIPHPAPDTHAAAIMNNHNFLCGEQFMMACKAFLFELPLIPAATATKHTLWTKHIDDHKSRAYEPTKDAYITARTSSYTNRATAEEALITSTFYCILRATHPPEMKSLGRLCPNFNPAIWDKIGYHVVVAASLARAKVDKDLRNIYLENWNKDGKGGIKKGFVEGSPSDKIWGVGMSFEDPNIDNPKRWRGTNLLGKAHGEACRLLHERMATGNGESLSQEAAKEGKK